MPYTVGNSRVWPCSFGAEKAASLLLWELVQTKLVTGCLPWIWLANFKYVLRQLTSNSLYSCDMKLKVAKQQNRLKTSQSHTQHMPPDCCDLQWQGIAADDSTYFVVNIQWLLTLTTKSESNVFGCVSCCGDVHCTCTCSRGESIC